MLLSALAPSLARGADVDFARDVKPILARHCTMCHSADQQESGLRLDLGGGVLRGGDGGAIVVAGQSSSSRLLAIVQGKDADVERMPPEGDALSPDEIAVLAAWIDSGAKVPDNELQLVVSSDHWSFQAPRRPQLPELSHSAAAHNPMDYFVLARLEAEGVAPAPEADRAALFRRVALDLLGIPPTPPEVEAFVNDPHPDAYERLVDRLLASPAYGERWGRHWLDLARYADSNGFTRDFGREIWKYRDWVIAAVNAGMPFDQFTIEQFAGDMLANPTLEQLIATGFHRNTLINEEGGTDPEQFRVDAVADRVATTGVVYLGLTLECARCHQHKYDPISQREYYQIFAFLNNCDEPQIDAPSAWEIEQGIVARRDDLRRQIVEREQKLAEQEVEFLRQQLAWEPTITPQFYRTLPGPTQAALGRKPDVRTEEEQKLIAEVFKTTETARTAFPLVKEIADLQALEPVIPTTMVLRERETPRETRIHRRGNFLDEGDRVPPEVPAVLPPLSAAAGPATRLDFARWLVDRSNPLTPRVVVNRYWQAFFGRGLVETENDFGTQGTPPTHPELLDWLAVEFVESGWDVKAMHRLLVTSATYRQSSRLRSELAERDPANKLLARQSRLRLDAEIIRDSALAASGLLSRKLGGKSVFPPQPDGVFAFTQDPKPWNTATGEDRYRRGLYTHFWRSSPYPALVLFDAPDANVTCTRRPRSNTPLQALTLANDVQFLECARALAADVLSDALESDEERACRLFRKCLIREPHEAERALLHDLVTRQRAAFESDRAAAASLLGGEPVVDHAAELAVWTAVARVLLNLDEFITRE